MITASGTAARSVIISSRPCVPGMWRSVTITSTPPPSVQDLLHVLRGIGLMACAFMDTSQAEAICFIIVDDRDSCHGASGRREKAKAPKVLANSAQQGFFYLVLEGRESTSRRPRHRRRGAEDRLGAALSTAIESCTLSGGEGLLST